MTKIRNPFIGLEGYNCFGCSPHNELGLKLSFLLEGEEIVATWRPVHNYQGYHNILHGGIQATLMDEIASWVVYVILKRAGFTSNLNVRYLYQAYVTDTELTLKARVKEMRKNLADIEVELFDSEQNKCAEALITYFTFTEEQSKRHMHYPGYEEFFEK